MSGFGTGGMVIAARLADPARPGNLGRGRALRNRRRYGERRMAEPDPDAGARRALARHRAFATTLLVLMAALTLGSYALPEGWASDLLQAAAKAGFVGGIADWFAVTALFRHPLGIPIPHTAIIPHQKERLGRSARPLRRHTRVHRPGGGRRAGAARSAGDPAPLPRRPGSARPAAMALAGMLPRLLSTVEDGRARRLVARIVPRILGGAGAGRVVARALHSLVEGGRHQEVFGFVLGQFRTLLASKEETLRTRDRGARARAGRPVGRLGARSLGRAARAGDGERRAGQDEPGRLRTARRVRRMGAPRDHPPGGRSRPRRRTRRGDPPGGGARDGAGLAVGRLVAPASRTGSRCGRPTGRTVAYIEGALANLGAMLEADPAARERVHGRWKRWSLSLLPTAQTRLAEFIAKVVAGWDTETIVERLELRIGKDLQYVRVNGTLVGFLVGGLLYSRCAQASAT